MAPVLCIVTTGDMSDEDALQGRFGDRYLSALLLFNHHRHEFDVRLRLGVAEVLTSRAMVACAMKPTLVFTTSDYNPGHAVGALCAVTVHRLQRCVTSRLTNDNADVTDAPGASSE